MRGAWLCWWAAWLLAGPAASTTELVFHVPDVNVRHDAAPDRPVGTGPHESASERPVVGRRAASRRNKQDLVHYEEYFVEHEISTVDARAAAKELRVEDNTGMVDYGCRMTTDKANFTTQDEVARLLRVPQTKPGCGVCSQRELDYCESKVIADHCCCEYRYLEPFPWLPHTCYMGAEMCKPVARDCSVFWTLRRCCCDRRLADKWKAILSSSAKHVASWSVLMPALLLWRLLL